MRSKHQFFLNLIVVASWMVASGLPPAAAQAAPAISPSFAPAAGTYPADIRAFHLAAPGEGWLQLGEDLYWTHDAGASWLPVTPPSGAPASLRAVAFLDAQTGWAVRVGQDDQGLPAYQLAQTRDGGASWQVFPLALFAPNDVAAQAAAVYLDFISPALGWLVVRQATSRAFDLGALFKTVDGGQTWTRVAAPAGDPVYFASETVGWMAGGPAGDRLYRTLDGGQTWASQALPGLPAGPHLYQLPDFSTFGLGILPVAAGAQVDFYRTHDGGQTWAPSGSAALDRAPLPGVQLPLSLLGGRDWVLVQPGQAAVVSSLNGSQARAPSAGGPLLSGITGLDMATPAAGWARYAAGDCQPASGAGELACTRGDGLLQTTDGGQSWSLVTLPLAAGALAPASNPQVTTGQGFDTCAIPALSDLQTWWDHSPYKIFNLYIGGSALAGCGALTASYISNLTHQGWKYIVTWAGPQASCFPYSPRMSGNAATAYTQGVSEADLAIAAAANLLLTQPDNTGVIIYYDLEYFDTTNSGCRAAAKSFISGWTTELHAKGNQAGEYSLPAILMDSTTNPQGLDGIWAAAWSTKAQFNLNASVWGLPYISDSLWANHQRLHQYAGGHNEAWGGVTFNIDCTVADGLVIDLSGGPAASITSPLDNTWLPTVPFKVTVTPVNPSPAISKVVFEFHSSDWANSNWVVLGTDTNGSDGWGMMFDPSAYAAQQGAALYAYVYDASGNRSGAGVWDLGIDTTPHVVNLVTLPMYGDAPFLDFHVRFTGTDTLLPAASYDVQFKDSASGTWADMVLGSTANDARFPGVDGHTYYFRARAHDTAGNIGNYTTYDVPYTVTACPLPPDAQEPDNTPVLAKLITVDGRPLHYNIDSAGDQNWTRFTAVAGMTYAIQTANTGGHADTVLYLYGPDATTLLASNDDYPGLNLASRVDYTFKTGGVYYLKVVHWDPFALGCTTEYNLSVTQDTAYLPFIQN